MHELALFAGAGGGILGGKLLGWRTVCAVEWDAYAASVLIARQNDGVLPPFPIWDDVRTFDGRPWRGRVDVVSGGFPCQDISAAGKGAGIDGERSGMWAHMARIIREVEPRYVFVENSPLLTSRGLHRVLGDLASLGYDARWSVLGAEHVGAPHGRARIWIRAEFAPGQTAERTENGWFCKWCGGEVMSECECDHAEWQCTDCGEWTYPFHYEKRDGCAHCGSRDVVDSIGQRGCGRHPEGEHAEDARQSPLDSGQHARGVEIWDVEPNVGRVVDGLAARVDRLKAIGNGQVPAVAALAWRILTQ